MDQNRCRNILLSLFENGKPAYFCESCRFHWNCPVKNEKICPLKMAEQFLEASEKEEGDKNASKKAPVCGLERLISKSYNK